MILQYDEKREFQSRGAEHLHAVIHVTDAPEIDENHDDKVISFIDKYITCSLPDKNRYSKLNYLVGKVHTHHHTITFRKKKGVTCRFSAPWPCENALVVCRIDISGEYKLKYQYSICY